MNAHAHFTTSAKARVLSALNSWFRHHSSAPGYREIGALAAVPVQRVRRYLDQLQADGHLTHRPGVHRSVVMVDRCANVCDDELLRACHGRRWTVTLPPPDKGDGL